MIFNNRVLIRPDPVKEATEGGVLLPDEAKERPASGTVVDFDFPPGVDTGLRKGMRVQYATYAVIEVEKDLVLIPYKDLWRSLDD